MVAPTRRQRVRANGSQDWSEWRWAGTRPGGSVLDLAGVVVVGVREDCIAWGRLYMEPVQVAGETIDEAVRRMAGRRSE